MASGPLENLVHGAAVDLATERDETFVGVWMGDPDGGPMHLYYGGIEVLRTNSTGHEIPSNVTFLEEMRAWFQWWTDDRL